MTDPAELHDAIAEEVGTILIGNDDIVEGLTIALLTRGHVLMEGVPGVAKTTIANLFACATGLTYNRIQMTPDILPADITGTHVYREPTGQFELQKGPVFANLVVADEINRATPKTQSALLEAMQEQTVTIEGETLALPEPFMVIATQNPLEMEGVFELPEAQRDRFMFKLQVDIPDRDRERDILQRFDREPALGPEDIECVVSDDALAAAREHALQVHVDEKIREYILDIAAATRTSPDIEHGLSPRGSLVYQNASKARAAIHGREYVIPDDVKALAPDVLRHRLITSTDAELSGVDVDELIDQLITSVAVPDDGASEIDGEHPEASIPDED